MTRQSALRRTGLFLLACVLAAVLAVPVLAAGIPDAPDAYVYDEAGVPKFSRSTPGVKLEGDKKQQANNALRSVFGRKE